MHRARVNRDDLRAMLHDGVWRLWDGHRDTGVRVLRAGAYSLRES